MTLQKKPAQKAKEKMIRSKERAMQDLDSISFAYDYSIVEGNRGAGNLSSLADYLEHLKRRPRMRESLSTLSYTNKKKSVPKMEINSNKRPSALAMLPSIANSRTDILSPTLASPVSSQL